MTDPKHTLHSTQQDEQRIEVEEGLFQIIPAHTAYTLYIGDFEAEDTELNDIFYTLRRREAKTLDIYINSNGGSIREGLIFHNILTNEFPNAVTTYLDDIGYSMGAMLFTLGNKRVVHEHSEIMFHTYTAGSYGKANELVDHIKHQKKSLKKVFKQFLKPYFSKQEIKDMMNGKDYWMNSKEMLKRNIATHILINGVEYEAKEYLNRNKKDK